MSITTIPKPVKARKVPKALRRTRKPRRQRKSTLAKLKRELTRKLSAYVKERDGNRCFTCEATGLEGSGWHAGHMFPAGKYSLLRYHPLNVHSQCFNCNINLGGNGAVYAKRFIIRYGLDMFNWLDSYRSETKAWKAYEIQGLIDAIDAGRYQKHYVENYE